VIENISIQGEFLFVLAAKITEFLLEISFGIFLKYPESLLEQLAHQGPSHIEPFFAVMISVIFLSFSKGSVQ